MPPQPALLVLDDGELSDLVALLNELGIEFAHLRGSSIPPQIAPPQRVIVMIAEAMFHRTGRAPTLSHRG
jgi:hypothetical protein